MARGIRYDYEKKIYRDCKFCGGRGCLGCEREADKAYKAAFPGGAVPIAVFDITTPDGVEKARAAIGVEAVTEAFREGGGGMSAFIENVQKVVNGNQ